MTDSPAGARRLWTTYVALGDSFTEGMCDVDDVGGAGQPDAVSYRGWADRLAVILHTASVESGGPGLRYANLAVRGRLLPQILTQQLPVALESGADLVSIVGGGNDVLRPGADPDALADRLEDAVARLRASGADVLMATGADPRSAPLVRMTRGKVATYNAHIWSIADRHGAHVIDVWGMRALRDWRMWAEDRIHMSSEGHRRVAQQAARALGLVDDDEHTRPLAPLPTRPRLQTLREDATWARTYVRPWIGRRLRGESSGDGRESKRPAPLPLDVRD